MQSAMHKLEGGCASVVCTLEHSQMDESHNENGSKNSNMIRQGAYIGVRSRYAPVTFPC